MSNSESDPTATLEMLDGRGERFAISIPATVLDDSKLGVNVHELAARFNGLPLGTSLVLDNPDAYDPLSEVELFGGGLVVNGSNRDVIVDGERVEPPIQPNPFKILHFLVSHPDTGLDRKEILTRVWDIDEVDDADARLVNVHVNRLRKRLGDTLFSKYGSIATVRKRGYMFKSGQETDE